MKNKILSLLLIIFALACGCVHQRFSIGHGDVGVFVINNAIGFGGSPINTNGLPSISNEWFYKEDDGGLIIHLSQQKFSTVESFLHHSFGEPAGGTPGANGYYRLTKFGGSIYFTKSNHLTEIIMLRSHPPKNN